MRWQSTGVVTAASSASTTGSPSVRFGTKWLSMTSTCSQSAVPATRAHSSARRAKSADRMLGEIWTLMRRRLSGTDARHRDPRCVTIALTTG